MSSSSAVMCSGSVCTKMSRAERGSVITARAMDDQGTEMQAEPHTVSSVRRPGEPGWRRDGRR